ncbi:hypothetical protein AOT93_24630 [Mycobacteroides sp. H110]|nr:hypothetical protein AOT87_07430 [Mycobacteroides sp. H003]KRQ35105.1 hypothetical protein AOT91_05845 [Mycobacteroides sp. H092]KRQ39308.1 hypothetical protein AOT92_18620 [Mycobacteroides sp. H101]KRQ48685.1 hypothetical protein AOT88_13430 [Mycobacteroides sp. H063]KRQ58767.1 hypothetical protein AOT94_10960 [Mycobacteroides sp. HXVII]KRQ60682.1 hypothetical protein AOT90_21000 [Mycobacteroides sp. H079]KRQ75107.1 hypothetical protein AOT93_24630 [Mycobacteroides sp. H110]KRQ77892.1 hy
MGKCEIQVKQHIYVFRGGLSCGFGFRAKLVGAVSLQRSGYQLVMFMLIANMNTCSNFRIGPPSGNHG